MPKYIEKEQRMFFNEDSLKLMRDIVQRNQKLEYGATICADKSRDSSPIYIRYIIKGRKESVVQKGLRCKSNESVIGEFHTHPNQKKIYPSGEDYHNMKDLLISCIGSNRAKPKINCYFKAHVTKEEENDRDKIIDRLRELDNLLQIASKKGKSATAIQKIYRKEHNTIEDKLLDKYLKIFHPEEKPSFTRTYVDKAI